MLVELLVLEVLVVVDVLLESEPLLSDLLSDLLSEDDPESDLESDFDPSLESDFESDPFLPGPLLLDFA